MSLQVASPATGNALDLCRRELLRRVEKKKIEMPVLPEVAGQVLALSGDPNADLEQVSDLIHKDQTLAGQVLRISNSAAYGGSERIVSLRQAIARLGMRLLGDIAVAVSLQGGSLKVPGYEKEVSNLWRHALASGVFGREIARAIRSNVEGQFLCGLLHSIGKPVVLKAVTDINSDMSLDIAADEAFQLMEEYHSSLGAIVAEEWNLPDQVRAAIAGYEDYRAADKFRKEIVVTTLSSRLATWALLTEEEREEDGEGPVLEEPVFEELNLYPDDVQEILDKRGEVLELVSSMQI